ncbi:MAG TPA: hypothetical protein VGB07_22890 [Blastocatellia bacterium]
MAKGENKERYVEKAQTTTERRKSNFDFGCIVCMDMGIVASCAKWLFDRTSAKLCANPLPGIGKSRLPCVSQF